MLKGEQRKKEEMMHMKDRGRDGGGVEGVERLNVSTWLIIQSDYRCLTAPTGRHP